MPHVLVTNSIKFAKFPFLLIEMPKTVFLLKIQEAIFVLFWRNDFVLSRIKHKYKLGLSPFSIEGKMIF